jgi:hypothetical protein
MPTAAPNYTRGRIEIERTIAIGLYHRRFRIGACIDVIAWSFTITLLLAALIWAGDRPGGLNRGVARTSQLDARILRLKCSTICWLPAYGLFEGRRLNSNFIEHRRNGRG